MNFLVNKQRSLNPAHRGSRRPRGPRMDALAVQDHFLNKAKHQSNATGPFFNADIRSIIMTQNRTIHSSSSVPHSVTAWHSISSNHPVVYMAISVGRGNASGEIGIATIDINCPTLVLSQLSDDFWFTGLLTKINIYQPMEIIVPSTIMDTYPTPPILTAISNNFSNIRLVSLNRRHFNDNEGAEMLKSLCAAKYKTDLLKIEKKYYALTSAAALLLYIGYIAKAEFAVGSLKIEYHAKFATMAIDVESAHRLELLFPLYPSKERRTCLMGVLDQCCTAIGRRHLRVRILQPHCDLSAITSIHECIFEMKDNRELMTELHVILEEFHKVDQLNRIAYIIRQGEDNRAVETLINQALQLKSNLDQIEPLIQLLKNANSRTFADMCEALTDPRYPVIADRIRHILADETQTSRNGGVQFFKRLHAVKPGINGLLDANRKIYSTFMDNIKDIIDGLKTEHLMPLRSTHSKSRGFHMQLAVKHGTKIADLPNDLIVLYFNKTNIFITTEPMKKINLQLVECIAEIQRISFCVIADLFLHIRQEMDAIYYLTGLIAELDILLSLAKVSIGNETWSCPKFCNDMRIVDAYHPFIEFGSFKSKMIPVPNNALATSEYNFFIITGPNMSGKTMYLKMIALLQIMAQIGCFVPAKSAEFRMCDKLFTRMGFNDNIEQDASSFIIEIREIEYIMNNITPNSLVLIDELCRSTNPAEGQMIAWKLCERMLSMNGLRMNGEFYKRNCSVSSSNSLNSSLLGAITAPAIFFTTHFMEIANLGERYLNVVNLSLSATEEANTRLVYTHKLKEGRSEVKCYGLALAETVRLPSLISQRAKEIYNQLMTRDLPPFNVSHQCVSNVSNATRYSRQSNPVDRTISGAASSSLIPSMSPSDTDRILYDLFANVMEIVQNNLDDNQSNIQLNELLQKFVDNLDSSTANSFANESIDKTLNDSVRFAENARNYPHFESSVDKTIGTLPGTDSDDNMDEEPFRVTQIENLCRTTQVKKPNKENVGVYTVNADRSAEASNSMEYETVRSVCSSPQLNEPDNSYDLSPFVSSGNNYSNNNIGWPARTEQQQHRNTLLSTNSSPKIYNSITNTETQFFIQSPTLHSSQIFNEEDFFINNSIASDYCSPVLSRNANNAALIEMVYADPDDVETPLMTPSRFPILETTHSGYPENYFSNVVCSVATAADSLLDFVEKNDSTNWQKSPFNNASLPPQAGEGSDIDMVLPPPPGF